MRNMALIAISLLCTHTQLFNCSFCSLQALLRMTTFGFWFKPVP